MGKTKTFIMMLCLMVLMAMPAYAGPGTEDDESSRNQYFMEKCEQILEVMSETEGTVVNTGVSLQVSEARKFYEYWLFLYYNGKTHVHMSMEANDICLRAKRPLREAYLEHVTATKRLQEIAAGMTGTDEEVVNQIQQYIVDTVSYADADTIKSVKEMNQSDVIDYGDAKATVYDAVIDQETICHGYAMMFVRLCSLKGISCEYVRNLTHAYNRVLLDGKMLLYDCTNKISGTEYETFIESCPEEMQYCYIPEAVYPNEYVVSP